MCTYDCLISLFVLSYDNLMVSSRKCIYRYIHLSAIMHYMANSKVKNLKDLLQIDFTSVCCVCIYSVLIDRNLSSIYRWSRVMLSKGIDSSNREVVVFVKNDNEEFVVILFFILPLDFFGAKV